MNPRATAIAAAIAAALEPILAAEASAINPLAGVAVEAGEEILNAKLGIGHVPAGDVLPHVDDPNAHPVVVAAGRAPQVPQQVTQGESPAEADQNLPDLYARLAAVEAKLNATIAAAGLNGSAAMAGHP